MMRLSIGITANAAHLQRNVQLGQRKVVRCNRIVAKAAPSDGSAPNIASPFSQASVHREVGEPAQENVKIEMTIKSVEDCLDSTVRAYLMADGGDVQVLEVKDGVVKLMLQGNCSTCAASSATLSMGIERALQAQFGEQFKGVEEVKDFDSGPVATTAAMVDMHLNMLRGAIRAYKGSVDVVKVEGGKCELRYVGPEGIGKGLKAAVKDQFKDLKEVVFVE